MRDIERVTELTFVGEIESTNNFDAQLLALGFQVSRTDDPAWCARAAQAGSIHAIVIGVPPHARWDALELARSLRRADPRLPVIFVAATSSEARAIAALRAGVTDYLKNPLTAVELARSVHRSLRAGASAPPQPHAAEPGADAILIGDSACMRELRSRIARLAASECSVLITGETGTGKELVADAIHRMSARRKRPLIQINCAAVPDHLLEGELFGYEKGAFTGAHTAYSGKLALANGGTVLLDEVGEMSTAAQAKLLRAIETREFYRLGASRSVSLDIRIIASTNADIDAMVADNRFRSDFYYRLNVARVHLPPLRERKEDIPLLFRHYLLEFARSLGNTAMAVSDDAMQRLLRYHWPGNIRELRNTVEAVFVEPPGGAIECANLPNCMRVQNEASLAACPSEREMLLCMLVATHWNRTETAQRLRWSRMTVYRKMTKYGIQPPTRHSRDSGGASWRDVPPA